MNATTAFNLTPEQIAAAAALGANCDPNTKTMLLAMHAEAKRDLAAAADRECTLRKACVSVFFPDDATNVNAEGTRNFELAQGYKLKAVFKLNYNLKQAEIDAALTAMEKLGNQGKFLAERIVKWKAELSVKEYRELEPAYKALIDKVLTTSPGLPSLEIVAPPAAR